MSTISNKFRMSSLRKEDNAINNLQKRGQKGDIYIFLIDIEEQTFKIHCRECQAKTISLFVIQFFLYWISLFQNNQQPGSESLLYARILRLHGMMWHCSKPRFHLTPSPPTDLLSITPPNLSCVPRAKVNQNRASW